MKQWFSQRIGEEEIRDELQIESIDEDLRTRLWNRVREFLSERGKWNRFGEWKGDLSDFCDYFWDSYLKKPSHELTDGSRKADQVLTEINEIFSNGEWHKSYSVIEFIIHVYGDIQAGQNFADRVNNVLKEEMSGYRLIEQKITPITDEVEIEEIRKGIDQKGELEVVGEHLKKALKHLSDRDDPDYENSIKESISAVESTIKKLSGDENADFSTAITILENKTDLHSQLKQGFKNLYHYTSDEDGIRHAMLEKNDISFADVKYMLVSCSAFINYLKEKVET